MSHYYSEQAYGPPPPAARTYYPSVPPVPSQQPYYLDPAVFRRDYTQRLRELEFNSRPIIQGLSMLAQDYVRFAEIVSECIETHIRSVAPWMKLPGFYLLDAISKNVYEPYHRTFARFVQPLFLETYAAVDDHTRGKMQEMLLTWRTGSPRGTYLFGNPIQHAIEKGVWPQAKAGQPRINKAQVLSELEFVLNQKERAVAADPQDRMSIDHIGVLHQLRSLVNQGVSQDELKNILDTLRNLAKQQPPVIQPQPVPAPVPQWPSSAHPPHPLPDSGSFQAPPPPSDLPSVNILGLLDNLKKAGLLSSSGTPVNQSTSEPALDSRDLERESVRAYRLSILSQSVPLTTAGLTRAMARIPALLYDRLPSQCKQCGQRFSDSATGKKELDDHLDMHFRQNRKASQDIGRGHSRSWFVTVDDWVHDTAASRKGKGRADGGRPMNAKETAAAEAAKRDAELRAKFVPVPPGQESIFPTCSICKEQIDQGFIDGDEEYIWTNAVRDEKDGRLYHATCHAEATVSVSNLAARLRHDIVSTQPRSRSGTPPPSSTPAVRSTPPHSSLRQSSNSPSPEVLPSGVKRKAEDSADDPDSALTGTPPAKKIALMAA
ncbi:hypothetical protein DL96DRAFT_1593135 [Flagelloscypha sp. PMI_526]|nr:hypothetical protein DL96DRAFT_1593135 [Flagelloscypha sp. PMI_526]